MPRKRIIDPEFWLNGEIAKISDKARLTYIGLWNFADDQGVIEFDPQKIRAQIFPYNPQIKMEKYLKELIDIKKLLPFEAESKKYLFIKNFQKYQTRLVHPSFRYPSYPNQIPFIPIEKRREVKLREEKRSGDEEKRRAFYLNNPMRLKDKKWYVIENGEWKEFAGKESDITWK